jgi:N-carbamoyl-L-amino-acid hydrolase
MAQPSAGERWRGLAAQVFQQLRELSFDGVGINRESYGAGEERAIEYVESLAHSLGLVTSRDPAQNLLIDLPGQRNGPAVIIGSHLDSVPNGGNFDGAAGVLAGLICLARLKSEGVLAPSPLRVISFRAEESAWFGRPCIGSAAMLGLLDPADLAAPHRNGTVTLEQRMRASGADVERIRAREVLLGPADVAAYFELHIEQGPVLVSRKLPTAVVTGIRGNVRHRRVLCVGEAGHSGAVPRWLRRDAVLAVSELLHRLEEHWRRLLEGGYDLVFTVGILGTDPRDHAITRIPGEVAFSFEARSQDQETLEEFHLLFRNEVTAVGRERKVEFKLDPRVDTAPARLDSGLIEQLLDASEALGLPREPIPSGAGHDAAVFARAGIRSAMVFVRNEHGSHNPAEAMDLEDFMAGVDILYRCVCEGVRPESAAGATPDHSPQPKLPFI